MAIKIAPGYEPPRTQTRPQRQESDGWFTSIKHRVKLALAGDDEELWVENHTSVPWHLYHKFHLLGIIDPGEELLFRLRKNGNLNARPAQESDAAEYLVVDLHSRVQCVEIYRRQFGAVADVYDMRTA